VRLSDLIETDDGLGRFFRSDRPRGDHRRVQPLNSLAIVPIRLNAGRGGTPSRSVPVPLRKKGYLFAPV